MVEPKGSCFLRPSFQGVELVAMRAPPRDVKAPHLVAAFSASTRSDRTP